jgi:hypothetical protein
MISKRHIQVRGNSTSTSNPLMKNAILAKTGQSTLTKRAIFNRSTCNSGTCDIKLNPK